MRLRPIPLLVALCICPLAFPHLLVADDYYIQWADSIDNGDWDGASGVAVDNCANIIVTGSSVISGNNDYFTVQYDTHGTILWHDTLDHGAADLAQAVAVDNVNNVIVTGYCRIAGDYDYLTVKYDADGEMSWADTLDHGGLYDIARGVATDPANNMIVTGYCDIGGACVYLTVKYGAEGAILWSDTLAYGAAASAFDVAVDRDSRSVVTGYTATGMNSDYLTVAYDSSGAILWDDAIDRRQYDYAYGVAVDGSNNVIIAGCSGEAFSDYDYYTVKYDADGTVLWEDMLDNDGRDDVAYAVAVDNADNIIVTGSSLKLMGDYDYFTVKYDRDGKILWQDMLDNGSDEIAQGVAVDSADNIVVTGKAEIGGTWDYFTVKYAPIVSGAEEESGDIVRDGWRLAEAYPNPFRCRVCIKLRMRDDRGLGAGQGDLTVRIATADGRLVQGWRIGEGAAREGGSMQITWDGRDGCGRRVPSGVYWIRYGGGDWSATRKVLLMR